MTPEHLYHLLTISNAPIDNTQQAKIKGEWLIETALNIEAEVEKARVEAGKAEGKNQE